MTIRFIAATILLFAIIAIPGHAQTLVEGIWKGTIDLPGAALAISVQWNRTGERWTGTIDIPAQGATALPLGPITIAGTSATFVIQGIPGQPLFRGTTAPDGRSMTGTFSQGGAAFPFLLKWNADVKSAAPAVVVDGGKLEGIWQGTIPVGGQSIRLVIRVNRNASGSISAMFSSPDQGSPELPVSVIGFKDSVVHFEIPAIQGSYDGKLHADGSTIDGTFTQGISQPLVLKKTDRVAAPNRPQEPQRPFPYDEVEVSYSNTAAGTRISGTLTRPQGKESFPAVLLITGSGSQDRDESLLGHKPFLVLSDHLTRQGIAVLRVDDRGVGGSTGNPNTATSEDFAGDVMAGVSFLKGRKEIDGRRIGLIGHSEGGAIAPMVASQSRDVAFIALLAAPGLTGEEILYAQAALIAKASGASDTAIALQREQQVQYYAVLKSGNDLKTMASKLRELGNPQPEAILSPWFRYFLTYDPRPTLAKTQCPVLAIGGEHDLQVPARENLDAIESALKTGGNKDYKTVVIPNLNHLFQTSATGSPSEYGTIEETFSPIALTLVSDWVREHTAAIIR